MLCIIGWVVSVAICIISIGNFYRAKVDAKYYSRKFQHSLFKYEDFSRKCKRSVVVGIISSVVSYIFFILAFPQTENSTICYILFYVCFFGSIITITNACDEDKETMCLLKGVIGCCLAFASVLPAGEYINEIHTKTATINFTEEMKDFTEEMKDKM